MPVTGELSQQNIKDRYYGYILLYQFMNNIKLHLFSLYLKFDYFLIICDISVMIAELTIQLH